MPKVFFLYIISSLFELSLPTHAMMKDRHLHRLKGVSISCRYTDLVSLSHLRHALLQCALKDAAQVASLAIAVICEDDDSFTSGVSKNFMLLISKKKKGGK
jgi:hypothetical protein